MPDLQAGIGPPTRRSTSGRVVTEPLIVCGLCGCVRHTARPCNNTGRLHPEAQYLQHEEAS